MEKTHHLSVKIIYWLTIIGYRLIQILLGILLLFTLSHLFFDWSDDLSFNLEMPFGYSIVEQGFFEAGGHTIPVRLNAESGRMSFTETPKSVLWIMLLTACVLLGFFLIALGYLKKFITNLYKGRIFDEMNIGNLKKLAVFLGIMWLIDVIGSFWFYLKFRESFIFESVTFTGISGISNYLIVMALLIWVLSHIFSKGMEIQKENELTV